MQASTFTLATANGVSLFVYRWLPNAPPKAVVQIVHGLAEHAARYARVAEALCSGLRGLCGRPPRPRPQYPPCVLSGISGWRDGVFIRWRVAAERRAG